MPRETIRLQQQLERLDILDKDGRVDQALVPELSDDMLRDLYRGMRRARVLDERMLSLHKQGRLGTFAPIRGQEAAQVGAVSTLGAEDRFVPAFREMAAELWRGRRPEQALLTYAGYDEGGRSEGDGRDMPVCIPVASQLPHAVGLAYADRYLRRDAVTMVFFGDGATSEGDFHEAMNMAAVFDLPVVFVNQNNQWAISTPLEKQTATRTLAQKGLAYGIPGIQVDGNDILAVHVAAQEAVARARAGKGPTLVECVTYRMSVHTTADDPSRYRDDEEVEAWEERDPLARYAAWLETTGVLDEEQRAAAEIEIDDEIDAAVKRWTQAQEELTDPGVLFEHLLAELPPYVARQREELESSRDTSAEPAAEGDSA